MGQCRKTPKIVEILWLHLKLFIQGSKSFSNSEPCVSVLSEYYLMFFPFGHKSKRLNLGVGQNFSPMQNVKNIKLF